MAARPAICLIGCGLLGLSLSLAVEVVAEVTAQAHNYIVY